MNLIAQQWPSKQEMLNYLTRVASNWRLLGEDEEDATDFYTILGDGKEPTGIGISSVIGTLGPAVVVPIPRVWIIGYNHDVTCLQIAGLKVLGQIRYETPFFAFANEVPEEPYLAIFETGVVAVDANGRKLWARATEIITHFERVGSRLLVRQMEGPDIAIDVTSGRLEA